MNTALLIPKAREHCLSLLENSRCRLLPFHNGQHTLDVFEAVKLLTVYENIPDTKSRSVLIAALFHDTGNAETFEGHEKLSVVNAVTFLEKEKCTVGFIDRVVECINATKMPQNPKNKYAKILCDADLFHLGTKLFFEKNRLLRREWASFRQTFFSDAEWYAMNLEFLEIHSYHTSYGKSVLEPIKQKNRMRLKRNLQRLTEN